jgi:dTDP-4-dehydrorhamnose 3,5-epimerase
MKFREESVAGLWSIDLEPITDHRGFFARAWCEEEFADHGLIAAWSQSNIQFSPAAGTIRGFHYQVPPHGEVKLVRCTRGSIYDVAIDLRPDSPTHLRWSASTLTAGDRKSMWIPSGCAHAYLTLEPDTEAFYMASTPYTPESVRGIRHDDPSFSIEWPIAIEHVPDGYWDWPDFDATDRYFWPDGEGASR